MTKESLMNSFIDHPLDYRSILTIPPNVNFGVELEMVGVDYDKVKYRIDRHFEGTWMVKTDRSLKEGENAEIVSPIMRNNKKTWKMIKEVGRELRRIKPSYDSCSFQVNFDGSLLETEKLKLKFLKLFAYYEDIIYRFSKGEDANYRESIRIYANPIILYYKASLLNFNLLEMLTNHKNNGIAFKSERDLIEFRTPNATSNVILWQNYITVFYYLLRYVENINCSDKMLDRELEKIAGVNALETYEELNFDKAMDFSSRVLTKKIDQSYFMQQYIGRDVVSL